MPWEYEPTPISMQSGKRSVEIDLHVLLLAGSRVHVGAVLKCIASSRPIFCSSECHRLHVLFPAPEQVSVGTWIAPVAVGGLD